MPRLSTARLRRIKHRQHDRPIALRHSRQHGRLPDAGHAVIRTKPDSGIRQKCMSGIPSTQPSFLGALHPVSGAMHARLYQTLFAQRQSATAPADGSVNEKLASLNAVGIYAHKVVSKLDHIGLALTLALAGILTLAIWALSRG